MFSKYPVQLPGFINRHFSVMSNPAFRTLADTTASAFAPRKSVVHRPLAILLAVALSLGVMVPGTSAEGDEPAERKTVVCSTTQVADFARQVVGDDMIVKCVMSPGQDPHTFEITPDSQKLIRTADLCLDNGLHLEGRDWMRTLAEQSGKPITSCTDGIKPLTLEEGGKPTKDPHAWFSPMNAAIYVNNVEKAVCELDPARAAIYQARADLYRNQLRTLHLWIQRQFTRIPANQRILVTSHDAFNYFCGAYGFTNSAPVGWSTQEIGAEVTPASRRLVIESIRKAGVPAIFVETSVNPKAIQNIAIEAGVKVGGTLYSDSMGTAGSAGESYVGMMVENVLSIVEALAPKNVPTTD